MKRYRLAVVLITLLILTGCKEYGEKRIVKLLTVSADDIVLYYYDYTSEKLAYLTESEVNNGIENTLTELLSAAEYDLKLCEYAVCSSYIIENNMTELFNGLNNSKFSPGIVILEGEITGDDATYINLNKKKYPVYTANMSDSGLNMVIENADNDEKNIITDGIVYKRMNQSEGFVLDIIGGKAKDGIYNFEAYGKKYSAKLENIRVNYKFNGSKLTLQIEALLKSYKGLSSNQEDKHSIAEMAEKSIKKNTEEILNDVLLTEKLKLLWYKAVADVKDIDITVAIK